MTDNLKGDAYAPLPTGDPSTTPQPQAYAQPQPYAP